jgi:hypothetical protein
MGVGNNLSQPAITYAAPTVETSVPFEIRRHLQLIYQKLGNHTQAFSLQQEKIESLKSGTSSTTEVETVNAVSGGTGSVIGSVNNQSGVVSYSIVSGDYGAVIVLSDSSPVSVTLNPQTPPWFCWISNLGAGSIALTPSSGSINGVSSLVVLPTYCTLVAFDGTNWWAMTLPIVPVNTPSVSHEWLVSYNATTGAFLASQPAFTDISGTASPSQIGTGTPSSGKYVDGGTDAWTTLPIVTSYHSVVGTSYLSTLSDRIIGVNYSAPVAITLVNAASVPIGTVVIVKDESGNAGTNNITITPQSGQNIEGVSNQVIDSDYDLRRMYSNGSNWLLV